MCHHSISHARKCSRTRDSLQFVCSVQKSEYCNEMNCPLDIMNCLSTIFLRENVHYCYRFIIHAVQRATTACLFICTHLPLFITLHRILLISLQYSDFCMLRTNYMNLVSENIFQCEKLNEGTYVRFEDRCRYHCCGFSFTQHGIMNYSSPNLVYTLTIPSRKISA